MITGNSNHEDARGTSPGAFAAHALTLHNLGISTVPCGKEDGKHPLVKWTEYQTNLTTKAQIQLLSAKFPKANLGIITGILSGLTVLDCDDREVTPEDLQQRFSESRFIVRTPSGHHLYFKHSGERNSQGLYAAIDIRGEGGLVVGPFSYNPQKNRGYEIIKGDFSDLKCLTPLLNYDASAMVKCDKSDNTVGTALGFYVGNRNNTLFLAVKEAAFTIQSYEELQTFALQLNQDKMQFPLPIQEVQATVNKIWEYKQQNRLMVKGQSFYALSRSEFEALKDEPNALVLYQLLKKTHAHNRPEFFIAQDAVAKLLGWNDKRCVRKAIDVLKKRRMIRLVKRGSGKGSPHIYAFC